MKYQRHWQANKYREKCEKDDDDDDDYSRGAYRTEQNV